MSYFSLGNVFSRAPLGFLAASGITMMMATASYAADYSCQAALRKAGSRLQSDISVRAIPAQPSYDLSMTQHQLTKHTGALLEVHAHSVVNGLTDAYLEDRSSYMVEKLPMPNGDTCVWPSKYDLQLGYTSMVVYIANEFRKGSCPYAVTMRHELEHVKINNETLLSHRADIEYRLKSHIRSEFPIRVPRGQNPDEVTSHNLRSASNEFVDRMTSERDWKHDQLDSPESYAYWQSLCHDWSTH